MPETTANSAVSGPIKLAVIPGDGIGTEVTAEALKVLDVATPTGVGGRQSGRLGGSSASGTRGAETCSAMTRMVTRSWPGRSNG